MSRELPILFNAEMVRAILGYGLSSLRDATKKGDP